VISERTKNAPKLKNKLSLQDYIQQRPTGPIAVTVEAKQTIEKIRIQAEEPVAVAKK